MRQSQHQVADVLAGSRAAWPARIRPLTCDQAAVPDQQRARRDEPMAAPRSWEQPCQRRQDRSVGPVRLGPGDLTPQHRDLMTQHHDLRILRRLASAEQHQPAKDPDRDQVEQAKNHEPDPGATSSSGQTAGHNTCGSSEAVHGKGPRVIEANVARLRARTPNNGSELVFSVPARPLSGTR
jgi:hypothetical protein